MPNAAFHPALGASIIFTVKKKKQRFIICKYFFHFSKVDTFFYLHSNLFLSLEVGKKHIYALIQ